MANTYTQIYIHYVFAVQNRIGLIQNRWRDELYKYMNGTIVNKGHKLLSIGGMPDHVHALVSISPKQSPSDLVADVKQSNMMNDMFLNRLNNDVKPLTRFWADVANVFLLI